MGFERRPTGRTGKVGFSEVRVGAVYHSDGYVVETDEVKQMSAMWDPFDFHLNDDSAEDSIFGGVSASGIHTLAISNLLGHYTSPDYNFIALLGAEYRLPAPAKSGDVLVLTQSIEEARPSNSRPGHGVVVWHNVITNQDDEVVLDQRATTLVGPGA